MKRRASSQNSGVGGSPSDCDIMASGSPDATSASEPSEAAEECSGKKKSKFQTFKNFFVKKKRKESPTPLGESILKASQSSDDINTSEPPVVQTIKDEELGSKINMGNKAMSHDSVFVSDSPSSENNEALGASQDSIHGKVKSLQLQLKQAIRLGSPPSLICGRKAEDAGAFSDDDGLPCSPPEYSSLHTVLATPPHTSADGTQRGSCLSMESSDSEDDQMSYESSSRPATPQGLVPADFSLPASTVSCLDSSAARHRIAVKAKACAKRKPLSRETLEIKRRNLREKLLLRDTEDKLRMVPSVVEEECEHVPGEQAHDSDQETQGSKTTSIASEHKDEEVPDSVSEETSPKSSISAGDLSEEEESAPDKDHVHKSEVLESPWESPVTLELQADDFLLEAGCDVVPEEQGSLLEEVLSSLKNPLVSGLGLEHENMGLQSEVADINNESVDVQLVEEANKDLLGPSELMATTKEQVPLPDSLSESTVDSEEITEETLEEEELLEVSEFAGEESTAEIHHVEREVDQAEKEEEVKTEIKEELFEKTETPEAFAVNLMEKDEDHIKEDIVEDKVELDKEAKVDQNKDEKISDLMVVELDKREDATNVEESLDLEGQASPSEPEKYESPDETPGDKRESTTTDIENVAESDQTVRASVSNSIEFSDQTEASGLPEEQPVEVLSCTVSHNLNSPILHSPFSNTSVNPLDKEPEPSKLHVSTRPQEVSSDKLEAVSEQQNVLESPLGQQTTTTEVRPRFTIAPAWQRSLASGVAKEQPQIISLLPPHTEVTNTSTESPQTTELLTPSVEEQPSKPARSQSSPALPLRKETSHVHEETIPENPFGVRLRKTAILHHYGLDGETSWTPTQTEPLEAPGTPNIDQHGRKRVPPKRPDLLVDTVMSGKKVSDPVSRLSVGDTESPSWISVARQKQRNFIENSPEASPEKHPSQEDLKTPGSLPSLSNSITEEQLTQPCSTIKVFCSLEISNTSMVEKESSRTIPSPAPLAQDEPPWMALAKKKAKAWSEMPQIVQ